jgi:hypothetical protein
MTYRASGKLKLTQAASDPSQWRKLIGDVRGGVKGYVWGYMVLMMCHFAHRKFTARLILSCAVEKRKDIILL